MAVSGTVRRNLKPTSNALKNKLKKDGLRLPHGYDLVLRAKTKKKK
jgi:hypothetical protein